MFLNVLALTPLLERFEAEHGSLVSVALFLGREYRPQKPVDLTLSEAWNLERDC